MKLKDNPLFHIIHTGKIIEKILEQSTRECCDISHADAKMLMFVGSNPEASQQALAESMAVSPAAVSRQIDRLVRSGHISREISPSSRRTTQISLTKRGVETEKKVKHNLQQSLSGIAHTLSPIDAHTTASLEQLSFELQAHTDPIITNIREKLIED